MLKEPESQLYKHAIFSSECLFFYILLKMENASWDRYKK